MPKKRHIDKNQTYFEFTFYFDQQPDICHVDDGNQEKLSSFEFKLRLSIKEALEQCADRDNDPLDRIEVAARMSRKLGREIQKSHIDQWSAMSTVQRRIHVDSLKAMCEVIGNFKPLEILVESCGFKMLTPDEAATAEYGANMLLKSMVEDKVKASAKQIAKIDKDDMFNNLMTRVMEGKE